MIYVHIILNAYNILCEWEFEIATHIALGLRSYISTMYVMYIDNDCMKIQCECLQLRQSEIEQSVVQ